MDKEGRKPDKWFLFISVLSWHSNRLFIYLRNALRCPCNRHVIKVFFSCVPRPPDQVGDKLSGRATQVFLNPGHPPAGCEARDQYWPWTWKSRAIGKSNKGKSKTYRILIIILFPIIAYRNIYNH